MAASIPNVYHLRLVAASAAKPCDVCYKSTPNVLITPDSRDFFYTCASHLSDKGFATPIVDKEAEEAKRKQEELEKEIEAVKKEYEEKMAKKKKKKGKKKEEKQNGKRIKDDDPVSSDEEDVEKKKDEKIEELKKASGGASTPSSTGPRVFELSRAYYNMRMNKLRNAQVAKRERAQRVAQQAAEQAGGVLTAASFPSVPRAGFQK